MSSQAPPDCGAATAPAAGPRTAEPKPASLPAERRRFDSQQLFGSGHEVEISHAGAIYRLRRTALGKLILTK